ncbi:MAG: hypothetical protein PHV16_02585 [Candidatus Nanoarchaeia archaeon]|nr:hypothetical protein [Candidatus Nanoarchaeia archaeon]
MIKSRKGIELSINFIVILILSIVIFGFGIVFLRNMMIEVDKIRDITEEDFNHHIENILCDSSEMLCIGTNKKEIRRNKVGFFTLGIRNTYTENKNFYIGLEQDKSEDEFPKTDLEFMISNDGNVNLNANEHKQIGIAIGVPGGAEKGTYVINVFVCRDVSYCDIDDYKDPDQNIKYGKIKKIYVVVN